MVRQFQIVFGTKELIIKKFSLTRKEISSLKRVKIALRRVYEEKEDILGEKSVSVKNL
jgi:hypothetical protein